MKYYGDYLGFQFGEHHSRDLGLYRVSDGDRYNDVSIPNFTDTTSKIPGGDGTYYWDSFYSQRTFTIQCAFDDLSETQLRQIRQIFNGKAEDWLVFDEVPYKKYRVKLQAPPQIKYLTFREKPVQAGGDTFFEKLRVHKGEITFQFISYVPYARDNFKIYDLLEEDEINYPNIDEWYDSVHLLSQAQMNELKNIGSLDNGNVAARFVYNPGDVPTDFKVIIDYDVVPSDLSLEMVHRVKGENKPATSSVGDVSLAQLNFTGLIMDSGDTRLVVDTATNLVYGIDANNNKTGTLYNKYISSGTFFKIPITQDPDPLTAEELVDYCDYIKINVARSSVVDNCKIEYDYLYY